MSPNMSSHSTNTHSSFKSTHIKLSPHCYQIRPSPTNMQLLNVLTVAFFAGTALAAPSYHPPPPEKPNKPTYTVVQQANQCGNNITPYCCNADNGSYSSCKAISKKYLL